MKIRRYRLKYTNRDISYVNKHVKKLLKTGYLTDGGPYVADLEDRWKKFNGSSHAIAVSSCTTGLECILRAINVEGYSVIVPAYTFIASAMSIYNCRGTPIYADISKKTLGLSLESIKKAVRKDTKAVMIVHVGGVISDEIEDIRSFCDDKNLFLIEDAACAHGAEFKGVKSGNFGHASCFSFHHSKVLTSGEGGIVTTSSDDLAERIKRIRAIGLDRSINNWESFEIGSNAKMSEMTAILGILHVKNADKIIDERRKIANQYDKMINFQRGVQRFVIPENTKSGYYKYFLRTEPGIGKKLSDYLLSQGIELPPQAYSYTCDQQSVSKKMGCVVSNNLENSKFMVENHICLPMYNGLLKKEIRYIIKCINKFLEELSEDSFDNKEL